MVAFNGGRVRGSHSAATWRVPRTRGAASGVLLVLLGAWGGLVPFVGPHFGYAYTPDATWTMTWGRLWLDVLPGAVAALCGLILIASASRATGLWAGWLAAVAGAWFVVGPMVSRLWGGGQPQSGTPVATDTLHSIIVEIGFYSGLGVVIVFLAATALGRFSVIGVRDGQAVAPAVPDESVPVVAEPVANERMATERVAPDQRTTTQQTTKLPVREQQTVEKTVAKPVEKTVAKPVETAAKNGD